MVLDGQISFWEQGTTPLKIDKPIRYRVRQDDRIAAKMAEA